MADSSNRERPHKNMAEIKRELRDGRLTDHINDNTAWEYQDYDTTNMDGFTTFTTEEKDLYQEHKRWFLKHVEHILKDNDTEDERLEVKDNLINDWPDVTVVHEEDDIYTVNLDGV